MSQRLNAAFDAICSRVAGEFELDRITVKKIAEKINDYIALTDYAVINCEAVKVTTIDGVVRTFSNVSIRQEKGDTKIFIIDNLMQNRILDVYDWYDMQSFLVKPGKDNRNDNVSQV